jgi:hypothetical protein
MVLSRTLGGKALRLLAASATAVASVLAFATPASATHGTHPVLLESTDIVPRHSPITVDGTDPTLFAGTLSHPAAIRSLQLCMAAGKNIEIFYMIPDLAPENTLPTEKLPKVQLIAPDGTVTTIEPTIRAPFFGESLNQHYLLLAHYVAPAPVSGDYSVVTTGMTRSRFLLATGSEIPGNPHDGIARGSFATAAQMQDWYAAAP